MFHENLKALRKDRGLSQEELAVRLNVVRQTISKWEKGLSVPDAAMLIRLAEVLDTTVSRLLGADVPEEEADRDRLAEQLARINEQLAVRNRRGRFILRLVLGILAAFVRSQSAADTVQLWRIPRLPGAGTDHNQRSGAAAAGRHIGINLAGDRPLGGPQLFCNPFWTAWHRDYPDFRKCGLANRSPAPVFLVICGRFSLDISHCLWYSMPL